MLEVIQSDTFKLWFSALKDRQTRAIQGFHGLEGVSIMVEKFSRWDAAEHLETDADMAAYLDACIGDDPGDGSLVRAALGDIARAKGMAQVARDAGISREGLYKALSPTGNPEFATVLRVSRALGLKLHAQVA